MLSLVSEKRQLAKMFTIVSQAGRVCLQSPPENFHRIILAVVMLPVLLLASFEEASLQAEANVFGHRETRFSGEFSCNRNSYLLEQEEFFKRRGT